MCALDTDPYTPTDYKNADPERRAEIDAWLGDAGMVAASCQDCDEVSFVCGEGCAYMFREEHATCAEDQAAADEDEDSDYAAYLAERDAERLAIASHADQLSSEQAQLIVDRAGEIARHVRGCNLSVEHCDTCCAQEQDHAASFWGFDVPAAKARLARERAEQAIEQIDQTRDEVEHDAAELDHATRSATWSAEAATEAEDRVGGLDRGEW